MTVGERTRRRLLGGLLALTVAVVGADLAGAGWFEAVRRASGAVVGPVQRVLAGATAGPAGLEAENTRLRAVVAQQQRSLEQDARLRQLLGSPSLATRGSLPARVVGTQLGASGGRSLTLDVGSRDGVVPDSTVVAAEGLVGRVVSVSPWTCDVQVMGSTGVVVAVRVGPAGTLGSVAAPGTSDRAARPRGTLALSFVQPGTPVVGDVVRTLGSVGERPYAAGVLVGTVTDVDPDAGRLTRTATVRPAVDLDAVDVVAVLVPQARSVPRPVQPPAGPATTATRP